MRRLPVLGEDTVWEEQSGERREPVRRARKRDRSPAGPPWSASGIWSMPSSSSSSTSSMNVISSSGVMVPTVLGLVPEGKACGTNLCTTTRVSSGVPHSPHGPYRGSRVFLQREVTAHTLRQPRHKHP